MLNLKTFRKQGIALFVVMAMTTVLALMLAAFFQAYRSHFALTRSSNASQRAGAACDSVYQYVVYRVEHDRTWGSVPFASSGAADPMGSALDIKEETGTYKFSGEIESLAATFEGEIYNNLGGSAPTEVSDIAQPGTIVCKVKAHSGESTRNAEFMVRVAPLFDSSVLSRANLDVDASKLYMRSMDENRNLLRAEGDIYVPDILTSKDSQFLKVDSEDADEKGMLWSKGDIYSYLSDGTAENIDEADELAAATSNSHGKIVAGAESDFSIFDLTQDNLQLPAGNKEVPLRLDGKDKPGRWNFIRRKAEGEYTATYSGEASTRSTTTTVSTTRDFTSEAWIDVLEYYPYDSATGEIASEPTEIYRAANRDDDLRAVTELEFEDDVKVRLGGRKKKKKSSTVEVDFALDDEGITTNKVTMLDYDIDVTLLDNDQLVFESEDKTANFTFDLQTQTVTASSNATVLIDGPFEVTSQTDVNAPSETPPPILDLGYDSDTAKAALVAEGTLNIENGVTTGLGALVSRTGDVKIQPMNTDSVTVDAGDTGSGLLVFAGDNVVLSNPDETSQWTFKGLVYARDGIRMDGHGQNAKFEGTIVALQENPPEAPTLDEEGNVVFQPPNGIEFAECGEIEFIYNNELLDSYVKNLPGQRIQLELVYWKR